MILDDEIDIIALFSEILSLNGINVRPFTNPEEALNDFKQNHGEYRLILSDVIMSPMSGAEFIASAREIDPVVNVILMTAFELEARQIQEIKPDEFFNKPIGMNDLIRVVKKYVK